jgi:hypothetical protein
MLLTATSLLLLTKFYCFGGCESGSAGSALEAELVAPAG